MIYDKIMWGSASKSDYLLSSIIERIKKKSLTFRVLKYGKYQLKQYKRYLTRSKCMIFLCEHESQGIAYQEALSMNVPVFAWDQGYCLDPNRFKWNDPIIPATSVPFFDERCGMKFKDFEEFQFLYEPFMSKVTNSEFSPREYILENLTLKKSAERMLEIIKDIEI